MAEAQRLVQERNVLVQQAINRCKDPAAWPILDEAESRERLALYCAFAFFKKNVAK